MIIISSSPGDVPFVSEGLFPPGTFPSNKAKVVVARVGAANGGVLHLSADGSSTFFFCSLFLFPSFSLLLLCLNHDT